MSRDQEFLTSNTKVAHPFLEENTLSRVTVDAYVAPVAAADSEIRLSNLTDPRGTAPVALFTYENGDTAFAGAATSSKLMGPWRIVEWVGTGVARLLFLEEELDTISWPVVGLHATLVGSCVQPPVQAVTALQAEGFSFGAGSTVELVAGNNVVLSVEPVDDLGFSESPRLSTQVRVEVVEGAGDGKYQDCDPERDQGIYTINGVAPDELGRFTLVPVDCYKLEVPTVGAAIDATELYSEFDALVEGTGGVKELLLMSFEVSIQGTLDGLPYLSVSTDVYASREEALSFAKQTADQLGIEDVTIAVVQLTSVDWTVVAAQLAEMSAAWKSYRQAADSGQKLKGPPWHVVPASLRIQNDCQPCCGCEDYTWVYDVLMRSVYERAKTMATRFIDLRSQFQALVDRMVHEKICREGPRISLRFSSYSGWTSSLTILIKNNQPCTVENFTLTGTFDDTCEGRIIDITASTNDGSTIQLGTSTYPEFTIPYNGTVFGTKTVTITVDVYYPEGGGRVPGLPLSVTVEGTIAGYPVWASASTIMRGPNNKESV